LKRIYWEEGRRKDEGRNWMAGSEEKSKLGEGDMSPEGES
jgi:hypothetical protein